MWWNQTLTRWRGEGLPAEVADAGLKAHLGLDQDHQLWVRQIPDGLPRQAGCDIERLQGAHPRLTCGCSPCTPPRPARASRGAGRRAQSL